MKLRLDSDTFDKHQAVFTTEMVERIKIKLLESGLEQDQVEDLTASIALSIAGVLDDLCGIEVDGVEVHPYLTFRVEGDDSRVDGDESGVDGDGSGTDELIHCGENAYTYDLVYGVMRKLFHS